MQDETGRNETGERQSDSGGWRMTQVSCIAELNGSLMA